MNEKPLYEFIHASDPHWGEQSDPKFAQAGERAACFVADVRRLDPTPSFMILTGDVASDANARLGELNGALAQLAVLPMPTWVVPGNHDLSPGPRQDRPDRVLQPLQETNWWRRLGEDGVFWVRRAAPLEFIGFGLRNGDPDGILGRLEAHLAAEPPTDCPWRVLVGHYPLYPARTGGTLSRWGLQHVEDSVPALRQLLQRHSRSVIAYLFGHIHALSAQVVDGVLHASGGAVAVGAPGFRIMSVFPDRLESRFVPLSDAALASFSFWGSPNRPEAAIDEEHATPEVYHRGSAIEQDFAFDFATRRMRHLDIRHPGLPAE